MIQAIRSLVVGLFVGSFALACDGGGQVVNDPDMGPVLAGDEAEVAELGVAKQAVSSPTTVNQICGGPVHNLGVAGLTGVPGPQARVNTGAPNNVYAVPAATAWLIRFSAPGGFTGTDLTRIQNDATNAESLLVNTAGVHYSYAHTTGNAPIKVVALADDFQNVATSIDLFASVTCQAGNILSEPLSIPGVYVRESTSNDACSIGIRLAKVTRLIAGTTAQDRVIKHAISWALAGIGGLGDTSASTPNKLVEITNRAVNVNASKGTVPSGQACIANNWTEPNTLNYKLCNTVGCQLCAELPCGY